MAWSFYDQNGKVLQGVLAVSIDTTELADDAVTAAKLADSINTEITANTAKTGITSGQASAITANTAKVTNATHTGDVTGATALTIAAGSVDIAHLSASNHDNARFLRGDNTWQAAGSQSFTGDTTITSGNLVMATAGKGIDFAAQTGTGTGTGVSVGSELLDHYEEGTWVPTMNQADEGGTTQTYNKQVGRYVRIGRTVFLQGQLAMLSLGDLDGNEAMNIRGLPFTAANITDNVASGVIGNAGSLAIAEGTSAAVYINSNANILLTILMDTAAGNTSFKISEMSAGGGIAFNIYYEI